MLVNKRLFIGLKEENKMTRLNSGEYAPKTGDYKMMKNGKVMNVVHVEKGEKMPPTAQSGCHYEI